MFICIKMDLALNNLQRLIGHRPKQTNKQREAERKRFDGKNEFKNEVKNGVKLDLNFKKFK